MKTALIVVDVQKLYTNSDSELHCKDAKATVDRINGVIASFERKKAPIFLIRHVHKADGSDLGRMFDFTGVPEEDFNFKEGTDEVKYDDRLIIPKKHIEIIKSRYSAFVGTALHEKLTEAGIDTVAIVGFMTNFCCESTARDAHDLDYFVDFVVDATGTPGLDSMNEKQIRKTVGEFLEAGFARVVTTKKYLKLM
jgi:nicotinamidase-related amidase